MTMRFVDGHAHMDNRKFNRDRNACIQRALDQSVVAIVNAGGDRKSSQDVLNLSRNSDVMWTAVGVHPHKASNYVNDDLQWLREMAKDPKVVAIGEMGLDFHYDFSPREQQRQVFESLMDLAVEVNLPAVVHVREADADAFIMLENLPPNHKVLLHCFSGDVALLEEAMDRGYYISLGGVVTFQNAQDTRAVARAVPLNRLILETDAPYLTPHPYRGKRNEPAMIPVIAEEIASIRDIPVAAVANATTQAVEEFYGIQVS